jgi:hypothetical protein
MAMSGYTKLFNSILASTIWRADDKTRLVWITLLAMADKWGIAEGSIPGLADLARVSVEDCRHALEELQAPDPDSRTKEHDGRRIKPIDEGWQILNHAKYRERMSVDERREYLRQKQAEYRRRVSSRSTEVNNVSDTYTVSTHAEAEAEAQTHVQTPRVSEIPIGSRSEHRSHAFCGRICVPAFLHREFVRLRGDDEAAANTALRAWYRKVDDGLQGKAVSEPDGLKFWRGEYKAAFTVQDGADAQRRSIEASRAILDRMDADRAARRPA